MNLSTAQRFRDPNPQQKIGSYSCKDIGNPQPLSILRFANVWLLEKNTILFFGYIFIYIYYIYIQYRNQNQLRWWLKNHQQEILVNLGIFPKYGSENNKNVILGPSSHLVSD